MHVRIWELDTLGLKGDRDFRDGELLPETRTCLLQIRVMAKTPKGQ